MGWVRVRGEVGRVVLARSGHLYFDLKDDKSVLSCMTWKGQVQGAGTDAGGRHGGDRRRQDDRQRVFVEVRA